MACDLPEDILWLRAARQDHVRRYYQVPRHLNDENVSGTAFEREVRADGHVRLEGVNAVAGRLLQSEAANFAGSNIDPRSVKGWYAPRRRCTRSPCRRPR